MFLTFLVVLDVFFVNFDVLSEAILCRIEIIVRRFDQFEQRAQRGGFIEIEIHGGHDELDYL